MEEGKTVDVNVFRSIPFNVESKVDFSTSGLSDINASGWSADAGYSLDDTADYLFSSGTLTFTNNGSVTDYKQTITLTGLPWPEEGDEPDEEQTEVFFVKLYNPRSQFLEVFITGVNPYPIFILEDPDYMS